MIFTCRQGSERPLTVTVTELPAAIEAADVVTPVTRATVSGLASGVKRASNFDPEIDLIPRHGRRARRRLVFREERRAEAVHVIASAGWGGLGDPQAVGVGPHSWSWRC